MNDKRFSLKILGVFMIEINNVTPEKIVKILWQVAIILGLFIFLWRLPVLITAIRWW